MGRPPPLPPRVRSSRALGDLRAGSMLGRYELLVPIAQGGMGVVWAAQLCGSKSFRKLVAVKAMLPEMSNDSRFDAMFAYEARIASALKHPNVCEVLDFGEHDGTLFIVMEWVDGEPLQALANAWRRQRAAQPLSIAIATRIGIAVARGLHAAHELKNDAGEPVGLVHCDVSPQNILATEDGIVKLVDFGLAKAASEAAPASDLVAGKLSYMAPEQATGAPVDARTDVFALGLVLYELVTGTHPFWADTPLATMQRIRDDTAPIVPPAVLNRACPVDVSEAIVRALRKDPAHRFEDMRELARALERGLNELARTGRDRDLAEFVRTLGGERIARRRRAIKEAVMAAEARTPDCGEVPSARPATLEPALPTTRSDAAADTGSAPRLATDAPIAMPSFRSQPDRKLLAPLALVAALGVGWMALRSTGSEPAAIARSGIAPVARTLASAVAGGGAARPNPSASAATTPVGAAPAAGATRRPSAAASPRARDTAHGDSAASATTARPTDDTWKAVTDPGF